MSKIFFSILFLSLTLSVVAQGGDFSCEKTYNENFSEGKKLYDAKDYKAAAKAFAAAICPDLSTAKKTDLDKWAKKCRDGINANSRKPKPSKSSSSSNSNSSSGTSNANSSTGKVPAKPKPEKPQVEILYSGYLRATCDGNVRGAAVQLLITAKNVKEDRLRVRCAVSPLEGSGRVNEDSPLANEYTIEGGLSGQEQVVRFSDEEECAEVSVFVPFGVMDLGDNLTAQMMNMDLLVYQMGETTPIAEMHKIYESISPYTITVNGSTDDFDLDVDYQGGVLSEIRYAVCQGNGVVWSNLPYWVSEDENGFLHVASNKSTSPRSATLHVTSSEGGNVVNINIFQKGNENTSASAKIKRVWSEQTVLNPDQYLYKISIFLKCDLFGVLDKEITYGVFFYESNGKPMIGVDGNPLVVTEKDYFDDPEELNVNSEILLQLIRSDAGSRLFFRNGREAVDNPSREAVYYIKLSEDDGQTWFAQSGPHTIKW